MSRVMLIAADKPLPCCDFQVMRTKTITIPTGEQFQVSAPSGFLVEEHSYYRDAVEQLHLAMKPHQVEFNLQTDESDLLHLKEYLAENFTTGEDAELWNLWVGIDRDDRVFHYQRRLSDLDLEAIKQFLDPTLEHGTFAQWQMTITI